MALRSTFRVKSMNFSTFLRWRLCKICKIFHVMRHIITKQVGSVFKMIYAIQKHSWCVSNASKTFFISRNARRHSILCVFNPISPKWLSWPQKEDVDDHEVLSWSAPENFWKGMLPQCLCLQASLGSYLSAETNRMVVRHLNPSLLRQTSADSGFWKLMLPQRHF